MRKPFLFSILCVALAVFVSCKPSDDPTDDPTTNIMKYDGNTYNISGAYLEDGTVTYHGGDIETLDLVLYANVSSKQYKLTLECVFLENEGISGDYKHLFNLWEQAEEAGVTHFLEEMFTSFNISNIMDFDGESIFFKNANVKIKDKGNNNCEVTFKLVCENGKTLEGNYSGKVSSSMWGILEMQRK